jgi:hypothetical protein
VKNAGEILAIFLYVSAHKIYQFASWINTLQCLFHQAVLVLKVKEMCQQKANQIYVGNIMVIISISVSSGVVT